MCLRKMLRSGAAEGGRSARRGLQARHCAESALFARRRRRWRLRLAQEVVGQLAPCLALLQKRCSLRGSGATLESKLRYLRATAPWSCRCAMRAQAPRTARCACSSRARNASSCRLAGGKSARVHAATSARVCGRWRRALPQCRRRRGGLQVRRRLPSALRSSTATARRSRRTGARAGRALAPQPRLLRRGAQVLQLIVAHPLISSRAERLERWTSQEALDFEHRRPFLCVASQRGDVLVVRQLAVPPAPDSPQAAERGAGR